MSVESLFNNQATLKTRTVVRDAIGGTVETFSGGETFGMRLQPTSTDETNLYSKEGQVVKFKAYVSAQLSASITDRVSFNDRPLIVRGVLNPDEADVYKVLFLEEQGT